MDRELAKWLGLLKTDKVLYYKNYKSALGKSRSRPVVGLTFWLGGKKITTTVNIAKRDGLSTKFLVGLRDLGGFLIKPEK